MLILKYIYIFFFLALPGHIATLFPVQALYLESSTRPYEIRTYLHRRGLQDPQQLWGRSAC